MNKYAMNTFVYAFWMTYALISLGYLPSSEIAELYKAIYLALITISRQFSKVVVPMYILPARYEIFSGSNLDQQW